MCFFQDWSRHSLFSSGSPITGDHKCLLENLQPSCSGVEFPLFKIPPPPTGFSVEEAGSCQGMTSNLTLLLIIADRGHKGGTEGVGHWPDSV